MGSEMCIRDSPILGTDFFRRNKLIIDIHRRRLVRDPGAGRLPAGSLVIKAKAAEFLPALCGLRRSAAAVDDLFAAFPSVTSSSPVYDSTSPAKHGVSHTVPTSGPPVFARARRLFGE